MAEVADDLVDDLFRAVELGEDRIDVDVLVGEHARQVRGIAGVDALNAALDDLVKDVDEVVDLVDVTAELVQPLDGIRSRTARSPSCKEPSEEGSHYLQVLPINGCSKSSQLQRLPCLFRP